LNVSIQHDYVENYSSRQDSKVGNFIYIPSHIQIFMAGLRLFAATKGMGAKAKLRKMILYHDSFPWVVAHVDTCGKFVYPSSRRRSIAIKNLRARVTREAVRVRSPSGPNES